MTTASNRVLFSALIALPALMPWTCRTAAAAEKLPNFVLIFTDDQGYQDVGCFGSPKIKTPNLDRMAAEGRKFTDFYVAAPICSPSRAALMTGCYCDRVGVPRVLFPRDREGLNPKEITIAEVLKPLGYATVCIGKWHLGHLPAFLPTSQGFDDYLGIPYSNDMTVDPRMAVAADAAWREDMTAERMRSEAPKRDKVPLLRGEEIVDYPVDQTTLTKRYTEESIAFIRKNKERPFFLYLPHTMPHVPLFASEAFRGKSERGLYGDVIEEIDGSVGEILGTLRELGLAENTLVIYTSDNGPWLSKGANGGCALPLRDGKFSLYEGGMREPCIAWWPGRIPAGTVCREVAATIDVLPTFAALAGAKLPEDRILDGRDIRPLLEGTPDAKSPHDVYFYRLGAVRSGPWKLHLGGGKGAKQGADGAQLYNLESDIAEKNNVAAEHPDVVERLSRLLIEHREEIARNQRPAGKVD